MLSSLFAIREWSCRSPLREQLERRRALWSSHCEREQQPLERQHEHRCPAGL